MERERQAEKERIKAQKEEGKNAIIAALAKQNIKAEGRVIEKTEEQKVYKQLPTFTPEEIDKIEVLMKLYGSRLQELQVNRTHQLLEPKGFVNTLDRGSFTYYSFAVIDGDYNDKEFWNRYTSETTTRIQYAKRFLMDQVCVEVYGKTFEQMTYKMPKHINMILSLNKDMAKLPGHLPGTVRQT